MKSIFTLIITTFIVITSFAQKFEITGQIKDNSTKEPVIFCYVNILTPADSLLTTCITDDKGYFKIYLDKGNYKFAFNQIGYKGDTTGVISVSADKFLDVFKLQNSDNELDELVVTGSSNQTYLDKEIQAVTPKMKIGAANSYDVLDKVKGLNYDRYNDQIKVDNEANILIIVNGIEKDANYIKNMNPERLLKIEIIRAPSGKYALQGYTAVVNIILKTNYHGVDVNFSNMAMLNFSNQSENTLPINYGNISLNYTNNKFNVYAGYSNVYNEFYLHNERKQHYTDSSKIFYVAPEGVENNLIVKNLSHNFNFGIDFYISPKHVLSYESKFNLSPRHSNSIETMYDVQFINELNSTSFYSSTINNFENTNFENSLYYIANFNDRNNLSLSYAFSFYDNSKHLNILDNDILSSQFITNTRSYSIFNAEFTHSFSPKTNINLGYGNTYKELTNTFAFESDANAQSFDYNDFRNQFYSYFSYKPTKKLGMKFGAAAENTIIKYEGNNMPYLIILPHFDIKYSPIKIADITLKYRANTDYPAMNQTNPLEIVNNWQMVTVGNPNLKPAKDNTVSARLNVMQGLFSLEPYYTFSDNSIIQKIDLRDDGIWQTTFDNAGVYAKKGIKGNFTIPFGKSLFLQASFDFFNEKIEYKGETHDLQDWQMSNQLIYQNKKHKTVAGIIYQNQLRKSLSWQGYNNVGNDFWSLLIQQPLFKDQVSVMVLYVLPTNFGVDYNQGGYTKTPLYEEYDNIELSLTKNMIMFRVTYRFSKGKDARKIDKNLKIEEAEKTKSFI